MQRRWKLASGAALWLVWTTPGLAQDAAALAAKFGALESVQDISLSPDGSKVAVVVPDRHQGARVFVADLTSGGTLKPIIKAGSKGETLRWCSWATDTRIVCQIFVIYNDAGQLLGFSRMVALNSDGSGQIMLTPRNNSRSLGFAQNGGTIIDWDLPGKPGHVLTTREAVPETSIGSNISRNEEGLGVDDLNLTTLARKPVERPRSDAIEYISDGRGNVRIMGTQQRDPGGYLRSTINYYFRKQGEREWDSLSRVDIGNSGATSSFNPYAVDSAKDVVYGFDDNNGFQALYSVSLDGNETRQLLLSRPDVDVDKLIRIGRDNRVVGASYATERRTTEFFDPELRKLGAALGKALPGQPTVSFIDASANETKLLLFASSDVLPGTFYRYDKVTRQLGEVLPVRTELDGVTMGQMKPITFTASDGTKIPGYLTLPPGSSGKGVPAIVMPHGGPGSRDEWGFDWLVQYFAVRGFAVLQPNFRGSTGYGSAWYQRNGFQSWRVAIGDVNDAGRWLVSQGIAAPDRLAIVGWSYGGYAALQSAVVDPALFKAIVAIAPVTDLERLRQESAGFVNFPQVDRFIGNGPHVRAGSPAQNAARIVAPVLLFHGDRDQNVGVGESRLMADKLRDAGKSVQFVEFTGLDHQLANAAARTRLLSESDAFIRKALGM